MFSSLPGRFLGRRKDRCEYCEEEKECLVLQGETDSFGYEEMTVCKDCLPTFKEEERKGHCEWCKKLVSDLVWTRDEGESNGPVYKVCCECKRAQRKQIEEDWLREKWRDSMGCRNCGQYMTEEEFIHHNGMCCKGD